MKHALSYETKDRMKRLPSPMQVPKPHAPARGTESNFRARLMSALH